MSKSLFNPFNLAALFLVALTILSPTSFADDEFTESEAQMGQDISEQEYQDTIAAFQNSKAGNFFDHAYGYAVFPTIGKIGFVIGGAYGKGRVYEKGRYAGNSEMNQASIGFQFGGQAYSQIIFFQDQRAYDEFTSGNFEFGANASAVVLTAGVSGEASTKGTSATANAGKDYVKAEGQYYKGMAVFNIAKGGLMYEAALSGQVYTFEPN